MNAVRENRLEGTPHEAPMRVEFKPAFVMISSLLLLVILFAFGRIPFFYRTFGPSLEGDPNLELYAHLYMSGSSMVTRLLIPLLIVKFVFRESPWDYGYRVRGRTGLFRTYLFLLAVMIPVLWVATSTEAFVSRYPLYGGAGEHFGRFLIYEAGYFFLFLSGESFWRGFIVFGLRERFGYYAILIMAIPYVGIHFGKPAPEAFGALLTGCLLGYLALKHRSFWLGVGLHFSVALMMDVFALIRKGVSW